MGKGRDFEQGQRRALFLIVKRKKDKDKRVLSQNGGLLGRKSVHRRRLGSSALPHNVLH